VVEVRTRWRNDRFEAVFGAAYDYAVGHGRLAKAIGRAMLGTDFGLVYQEMAVVGTVPDGAAILDVPCGGGVALRNLSPARHVRYVAADISPTMLARTQRLAARLGVLRQLELVEADAVQLPFADGEFDLVVCFNGLHCLPDPASALRELGRCVKPGGQLVGDTIVRGERRFADTWMVAARANGVFGPTGTTADLRAWLTTAGLRIDSFGCSGAVARFRARRPGGPDHSA
jgi:SAM-dependent methyltransferase